MSTTDPIEDTDLLPEPLDFLANEIKQMNEEYWLENRPDLIGAEEIRKDGFTQNQRRWINNIARRLKYAERLDKEDGEDPQQMLKEECRGIPAHELIDKVHEKYTIRPQEGDSSDEE